MKIGTVREVLFCRHHDFFAVFFGLILIINEVQCVAVDGIY